LFIIQIKEVVQKSHKEGTMFRYVLVNDMTHLLKIADGITLIKTREQ